MENKDIKDLIKQSKMNNFEFARFINAKNDTVYGWVYKNRKPPAYVLHLIEYKLKKENIIKDEE